MKAIAVFCIFALFAITFVQCEKTSFKNLTHNKTGLPHFAHHNRTVQVPHFPKFNKTHGIKPAFPHFNKTNILRKALKADEAEDEFFFRTNKTHQNKTHGVKPAPKFNITKPVLPKFNITKPKFNISKPKFNISKPAFPKFNKTNILRHTLKADEAEDEELFSFFNRNKTQTNKTHKATNKTVLGHALRADEAEDEFFFRTNKTHQNKTHGAKPFPKFNVTKPVLPKFNVTKPKFNISKPAFPKFNSTLRHALKADEAEDDEFFFRRNATRVAPRLHNKTHQANHTVGIARHNLTHPIINKNHTNKGFLKF